VLLHTRGLGASYLPFGQFSAACEYISVSKRSSSVAPILLHPKQKNLALLFRVKLLCTSLETEDLGDSLMVKNPESPSLR
jgi:hypothetical protein